MRIAFNLLIISILVVCIWFVYVSVHSKAYYRRVYKWILWASLWMYVNRLLGVAMEEGFVTPTDALVMLERMVHYLLTLVIYSLFAYFIVWTWYSNNCADFDITLDAPDFLCGEW